MSTTEMSTLDYAKARELMVEQQVRPWDVLDARVLAALRFGRLSSGPGLQRPPNKGGK
jgi:hypothetical protein